MSRRFTTWGPAAGERVPGDAYARALHTLVERRRCLDDALAAARERPGEVDVVDLTDLALGVQAAEVLVERLASAR